MMNEKLKIQIQKSTNSAGIYRFIDENDEILYIGKAKNLHKRLISYTKSDKLCNRIRRMTFLAIKIEITQTNSDLEAILLEHNLIKKHKPKFNILLKDDKRFAAIAIDKKHDFGAIFKNRGLDKKDLHSFGPFASALDVNRVIDILRKSFLLRNCSDNEFKRRKKPCLEYQIKKCSAPCVDYISKSDYQDSIKQAVNFLSGKSASIQQDLAQKMQKFSENQEYEKAAAIRDKIKSLSSIQATQNINSSEINDADFINLIKDKGQYCVYISFYRAGNNYGSKPYFHEIQEDLSDSDFLCDFLGQFYQNEAPPKEIFINREISDINLMEDFLSELAKEKVKIKIPKQGEKLKILQDQAKIAFRVLAEKIAKNLSDKKLLLELKEKFNLEKIPQRIEIYDNSHTANQNAVGAMVVSGLEGFVKNQYRKFNIRFDLSKNRDDTAMMKEVFKRRFKNTKELILAQNSAQNSEKTENKNTKNEDPKNAETHHNNLPDLIIIDGGLPQLSAAKEAFAELKIEFPLICMAKGENRNAGEETYFKLDKSITEIKKGTPLAFYLQRLRDEAHRFAISSHRARRTKNTIKSSLDQVSGIGSKRKKALLNYFGSVAKIKEASVEDLTRIDGINEKVAKKILEEI